MREMRREEVDKWEVKGREKNTFDGGQGVEFMEYFKIYDNITRGIEKLEKTVTKITKQNTPNTPRKNTQTLHCTKIQL